ncbi:MAG: hypothetical protein KAR56_00350 [Thermoplasmata archaeon]|nr:hypothetical protein [Thermoplasmata archaeon]
MSVKDMYADLERIEARGKRKKEKRKGFFSRTKKEEMIEHERIVELEPSPDTVSQSQTLASPEATVSPALDPVPGSMAAGPATQSVPLIIPDSAPRPAVPEPEPTQVSVAHPEVPEPVKTKWFPLSGSKLKRAETHILEYKAWLNKRFKAGKFTKQECLDKLRHKEVELGLRQHQ